MSLVWFLLGISETSQNNMLLNLQPEVSIYEKILDPPSIGGTIHTYLQGNCILHGCHAHVLSMFNMFSMCSHVVCMLHHMLVVDLITLYNCTHYGMCTCMYVHIIFITNIILIYVTQSDPLNPLKTWLWLHTVMVH